MNLYDLIILFVFLLLPIIWSILQYLITKLLELIKYFKYKRILKKLPQRIISFDNVDMRKQYLTAHEELSSVQSALVQQFRIKDIDYKITTIDDILLKEAEKRHELKTPDAKNNNANNRRYRH